MHYIFTPYKDELIYSWIGRYSSISGNKGYKKINEELFGISDVSVNVLYANYLEHLSNQIPVELNVSSESLIKNNTLFPFFKPFISEQRINEATHIMKYGGGNYLTKMGILSGKYSNNVIKYCPLCVKEDEINLTEAYIHRIHQLPGNLICHKHEVYLNDFEIINDRRVHCFKDINNLDINYKILKIEKDFKEHLLGVTNGIEFILNGGLHGHNFEIIFIKYSKKLMDLGYKKSKCVISKQLFLDFLEYYPLEFLKKMGAEIDIKSNKRNWINSILMKNDKQLIHPIKHLLLIRFLFKDIRTFSEFEIESELALENEELYPCLNVLALHYKMKTSKVILTYKSDNTLFIRCKCSSCGFTYTSKKQKIINSDFRVFINDYGYLWDETLKDYIMSKKYKISELSRLMNTSIGTIERHIIKLGLEKEFEGNLRFDILKKNNIKEQIEKQIKIKLKIQKKLELYKKNILNYISSNNTNIIIDIRENNPSAYKYIRKYDKQWINDNLKSGTSKKYYLLESYWEEKDKDLSSKITLLADNILKNNIDIRITKRYFSKKLNYANLQSKLEKLPVTKKIIENVCETIENYNNRINNVTKIKVNNM